MQWSCPHCGVSLVISDDTLGTGWSFSRCYKCGGFALIRKAEINIIKVDKAPPGERIILPEASVNPASVLVTAENSKKTKKQISESVITAPPEFSVKSKKLVNPADSQDSFSALYDSKKYSTKIPLGIVGTGTLAVISGVYLFVQGQTIWFKVHENLSTAYDDHSKISLASDVSLRTKDKGSSLVLIPAAVPEVIDQVHQIAMAPIKDSISKVNESEVKKAHQEFLVRSRYKQVNVHSGPNMRSSIIGQLKLDTSYLVSDWSERWFRLNVGWVRNDMIQVLPDSLSGGTAPKVDPLR